MPNLLKELEIIEGKESYTLQIYDEGTAGKIGDLNNLITNNKNTIVNAINEVKNTTTINSENLSVLQSDVTGLSSDVTGLSSDVTGLSSDVTGLSSDVNNIENKIGTLSLLKTNAKNNLVNAINSIIDNNYVNVKNYGAIGDGITDDYNAFISAINNTPIHGTLFIPIGCYYISNEIIINKPIRILGSYSGWDVEEASSYVTNAQYKTPLIKSNSSTNGIYIKTLGVTIEHLSLEMINSEGVENGIIISNTNATVEKFDRFNTIINCTVINNSSQSGSGIRIQYCGLTLLERIHVYGFEIGFFITQLDDTHRMHTSLTLLNCWAQNYHGTGYNANNVYYSSFINCASDTLTATANGYVIQNCKGVSLINCGAEKNENGFILDDCFGCDISGVNVSTATAQNGVLLRYSGWIRLHDLIFEGSVTHNGFHCVYIQNTGIRVLLENTNASSIYNVEEEIAASDIHDGFYASNYDLATFTAK